MKYEILELNEEVRASLPGQFVKLSNGYVHYELAGPENGEVVVLIHGFSSPMMIWNHNFQILSEAGFRVLRYDLYGRGYSDRPKTRYNTKLFDQQLYELVNKLDLVKKEINLVGLSMGGGIAVIFTDQHSGMVGKITLIDPIGFSTNGNIFPILLKMPKINYLRAKLMGGHKWILEAQREDFHRYNKIDEYLEEFSKQFLYKGFLRAILSTIQYMPFNKLEPVYQRIANLNLPMQLFWGEYDKVIPFQTNEKVRETIPFIQFHPVKECGHLPNYTKPEEVNPILIEFLKEPNVK